MYKKLFKRLIDFILAIVLLIITSPILLIAVILLRFENKGKIIFKQKRIGKGEKEFYIYKLRTMAIDKEDGINKVTKLGKVLRTTSIDELPQLINILKGEMSFIGPRPWIEKYTRYFNKQDRRRSEVLPGLSGWAQVQGRNDMSIKEKLAADTWYVDHVTFKTDFIIFVKTIAIVFKKTGSSITEKGIEDEINELKERYQKEIYQKEIYENGNESMLKKKIS